MDEPLVDSELADSAPQRRSGPWKLILVVAIATLIGVWLVPGDSPDDAGTGTAPETAAEGTPQPPSLLDETEATAEAAAPVDRRPGAKARALIAEMRDSGNADLDRVYREAERAQAAGELPDAYLLYFFAAREGHAPSALALGRQADPASHVPASSVFEAPDLTQAHKWYDIAARNGSTAGREQLAALRGRVDRMAAEGDAEAQRISLLWQ